MTVLSLVAATIAPERHDDVIAPYAQEVERGLPPGIRETFLLVGEGGELAIATLWSSREHLDAMRASGEPTVRLFDLAAEAHA